MSATQREEVKHMKALIAGLAAAGLFLPVLAGADIAVVVQHPYCVGNNYFSAFAYDPVAQEFRSGGYNSGADIRWSHVLSDANQPWTMEGDVLLNWFQLGLFYRDGYPSNSCTFNMWGMNYNPLDGKYFGTVITTLRPPSGGARLDAERDLIVLDDRLPDSLLSLPNGVTLSNVGGIYRLTDTSTTDPNDPNTPLRAMFVTSGVAVGDRITLFPIDVWAEVLSATYTVTQVVSETEIRLDRDPCWGPETTATGLGYLLSIQPQLTLATFRQNIPYFAANLLEGPKAAYTGALSADGQTLYLSEQISDNIIAVDTQVKESFTIFVSKAQLQGYVQAQVNAGRRHAFASPVSVYSNDPNFSGDWTYTAVNAVVDPNVSTVAYPNTGSGQRSIGVTYSGSGAKLVLDYVGATPLNASDFRLVRFAIHGGTAGGQQLSLYAVDDANTPGNTLAITPPTASTWTLVELPATQLGVSTIGGLVWQSTSGAAQPRFYIDAIDLPYVYPAPPGIAPFDPNSAGAPPAQLASDPAGRIWFTEDETDDLIWTTDGVTLHTFMTSNDFAPIAFPEGRESTSTGLQVMGLTIDRMGTVYWSDNQTKDIWKMPACGGIENLRCLATDDEIKAALYLPSVRGMNCFTIRGTELLTFNFVDGNYIYKVDLDTFDYGDFDNDVDVDTADLNLLASVLQGPDVLTPPPGLEALFTKADLNLDGDVDLADAARQQRHATGPL